MSLRLSNLKRTVAPEVEPITVAEAKAQLRVLHTDDDDYITALIGAAREWAESFTRRAFVEQTWIAQYAGWPADRAFDLARFPIMSLESVSYRDSEGDEVELDETDYTVDAISGVVMVNDGVLTPELSLNYLNPISITFVAGYVATDEAADLPKNIKQALLLAITNFYENRVPVVQGTITSKVPLSIEALLKPIKLYTV